MNLLGNGGGGGNRTRVHRHLTYRDSARLGAELRADSRVALESLLAGAGPVGRLIPAPDSSCRNVFSGGGRLSREGSEQEQGELNRRDEQEEQQPREERAQLLVEEHATDVEYLED